MLISVVLPDVLSLGKVPKGKTINLDVFELVWSDEFEDIQTIKQGISVSTDYPF